MKMPPVRYHRPGTAAQAVALFADLGGEVKVLAGGQSLLPILALRMSSPDHLVDIGGCADLGEIAGAPEGGLVIGARATHADVEHSALVADRAPVLATAMRHVGHRAIRTRGTVCGSLAHADPAAEWPSLARALDADLVVEGPTGRRTIRAADFFAGYLQTVLGEDDLLIEVRFPGRPRAGWSVLEVSRRHGDFALASVIADIGLAAHGTVSRAALAHLGVAPVPWRSAEAEEALLGARPSTAAFETVATEVARHLDPPADNHATSSYRRHLATELTRRALTEAVQRAEAAA